jgi:hypothetical protein
VASKMRSYRRRHVRRRKRERNAEADSTRQSLNHLERAANFFDRLVKDLPSYE